MRNDAWTNAWPGRGGKPTQKADKKVIKRLLGYLKPFKLRLVIVLVCILISAFTGVLSAMFLRNVIDDYITPLLASANPSFAGLLQTVVDNGSHLPLRRRGQPLYSTI